MWARIPQGCAEDIGRAVRMSAALKAGTVWVNTYRALSYMMPFGGMKHSGIGRESGDFDGRRGAGEPACYEIEEKKGRKRFFFEKKKQKT